MNTHADTRLDTRLDSNPIDSLVVASKQLEESRIRLVAQADSLMLDTIEAEMKGLAVLCKAADNADIVAGYFGSKLARQLRGRAAREYKKLLDVTGSINWNMVP